MISLRPPVASARQPNSPVLSTPTHNHAPSLPFKTPTADEPVAACTDTSTQEFANCTRPSSLLRLRSTSSLDMSPGMVSHCALTTTLSTLLEEETAPGQEQLASDPDAASEESDEEEMDAASTECYTSATQQTLLFQEVEQLNRALSHEEDEDDSTQGQPPVSRPPPAPNTSTLARCISEMRRSMKKRQRASNPILDEVRVLCP